MPDERTDVNRQADPVPQAQLPPTFLHDLIRDIINRHDTFVTTQSTHCNITHLGVAEVTRKQDEVIKQQTIKLIKLEETTNARLGKVEGKVAWFVGVGWWVSGIIGAILAMLGDYFVPLIMDKFAK